VEEIIKFKLKFIEHKMIKIIPAILTPSPAAVISRYEVIHRSLVS
jgi:hypothetical protein